MAARQGFEPRQKEPESFVLPLHHRANANYHARLSKKGQAESCACEIYILRPYLFIS